MENLSEDEMQRREAVEAFRALTEMIARGDTTFELMEAHVSGGQGDPYRMSWSMSLYLSTKNSATLPAFFVAMLGKRGR